MNANRNAYILLENYFVFSFEFSVSAMKHLWAPRIPTFTFFYLFSHLLTRRRTQSEVEFMVASALPALQPIFEAYFIWFVVINSPFNAMQ